MARTFKSEEDVFRELGRELGRAPNETVWALIVADRLPNDVVSPWGEDGETGSAEDAEAAFAELVDKYRRTESLLSERGALNGRRRAVPPPDVARSAPSTDALAALSYVMALEAQAHPLVVAFRERVLGGTCVPVEDVTAWHLAHDGPVKFVYQPDAWPMNRARENAWAAQVDAERYAAGELPVPPNEAGDFLYCVADVLVEAYGWSDPKAVADLILSGKTPRLHAGVAYVRPRERFFPKSTSVHLVVNPQMDPRKVMELYAKMRHTYMAPNTRIRPPGEKASRLAVFVAGHNDGSSWEDVRKAWNADNAEQFADYRSFARDARKAYTMVTGESLEWHAGSERGEKP